MVTQKCQPEYGIHLLYTAEKKVGDGSRNEADVQKEREAAEPEKHCMRHGGYTQCIWLIEGTSDFHGARGYCHRVRRFSNKAHIWPTMRPHDVKMIVLRRDY